MARAELEPGSFRDPDSRVFYGPGGVFRALSEQGLADWSELARTGLYERLRGEGKLVATELVGEGPLDGAEPLARGSAAVLRHEAVPFVSYPYEWPFSMLRDAALLQLELLRAALAEEMTLKDATPYNVQWCGARPVFVDVGSFERLRQGEPWAGYRQFCMQFLYPLMLQAYKGVPFQPWLRGSLQGIEPTQCRALMGARDLLRRGVLPHVVLHSRLERRNAERAGEVRGELRRAGFRKELIEANARRLERLVRRLRWRPPRTAWSEYGETTSYAPADAERKASFVREVVGSRRWGTVWDLGANDGRFARIAADNARCVVAADADAALVERLYLSLRDEGSERILPLVLDLADPSPGLGWRGLERRPLAARGRPELVLCLALAHHVSIAGNVPVRELFDWLAELGGELVIELVAREDPMVRRLLAGKRPDAHPDYRTDLLERALRERFELVRSDTLGSGTRTLHHAVPRAAAAR